MLDFVCFPSDTSNLFSHVGFCSSLARLLLHGGHRKRTDRQPTAVPFCNANSLPCPHITAALEGVTPDSFQHKQKEAAIFHSEKSCEINSWVSKTE